MRCGGGAKAASLLVIWVPTSLRYIRKQQSMLDATDASAVMEGRIPWSDVRTTQPCTYETRAPTNKNQMCYLFACTLFRCHRGKVFARLWPGVMMMPPHPRTRTMAKMRKANGDQRLRILERHTTGTSRPARRAGTSPKGSNKAPIRLLGAVGWKLRDEADAAKGTGTATRMLNVSC